MILPLIRSKMGRGGPGKFALSGAGRSSYAAVPRVFAQWLAVGATTIAGANVGLLLYNTHHPEASLAAVLAVLAGGAMLLYARSKWLQAIGYLLGLGGIGFAVRTSSLAVLSYAPWLLLAAVEFHGWVASVGVGAAGIASYFGGRWAGGEMPLGHVALVAAATIGLIHLGTLLLVREALAWAQLAMTDPLTGLANRRMLRWRLTEELAQAERTGDTVTLLCLDANEFKRINDTLGHHIGDQVLIQVSTVLRSHVRPHDVVARVGGDEFVVMAAGLDDIGAARVADRLQTAAGRASVPLLLGLTAGWVIGPRDGRTPEALLDLADACLFEHKRGPHREGTLYPEEVMQAAEALPDGVQRILRLLDAEDIELEVHLIRVAQRCLELARSLGLPAARQKALLQAALAHDVGKVALPRALLRKVDPLTPEEWMMIHQHVSKGIRLLRTMDVDEAVVAIVAAHHERWDGTGYPAGLAGEAIPIETRVLTLADGYDAMRSIRPYRQTRTAAEAAAELRREAGRQFAPDLVDLLISLLPASE